MWTYEQSTGRMIRADGEIIGQGYSGAGEGKNNPAMQTVANVGPLPAGRYYIGEPIDTARHGPYALPLQPAADNWMFGRSEFLIHGDSIPHPGDASEGCIIQLRSVREEIWQSGDHDLEVVPSAGSVQEKPLEKA